MPSVHVLMPMGRQIVPFAPAEIRAFVPVRNEIARLGFFLQYHRRLGVDRFFFVDNGSSDGTTDYLLAQPDCHVFRTLNSFRESNSGMDWLNFLLSSYGAEHWCLTIDADELFVYPGCEQRQLREFADFLDLEGAEAVLSFLLDMYADKPIADTHYKPGQDFRTICPYFDRDYHWVTTTQFPGHNIYGGPRARLFYPDFKPSRALHHRLRRRVKKLLAPGKSIVPPYLMKIPFVRWSREMEYESSHRTRPLKLSTTTSVSMHFKFFDDFYTKLTNAALAGQYWDGGSEYKRYNECLRARPELGNCWYDGSVRYEDSQQLSKLGLIHDPVAWHTDHTPARAVA